MSEARKVELKSELLHFHAVSRLVKRKKIVQ